MKKGTIILWPTILAVLIGLAFLFVSYNYGTTQEQKYLGEAQLNLIITSLDVEKKLLYNDILLQQSIRNASNEFGQSFSSRESYFDYPMLLSSSQEDVKSQFKQKVTDFIATGVENSPYGEIRNSYDYFLLEDYFIALPQHDFSTPTIQESPGFTIEVRQSDITESLTGQRTSLQQQNLVDINNIITCAPHVISRGGCKVRNTVAEKLRAASQIASSRGYKIFTTSAYRSLEHQTNLFQNACQRYRSCQEARRWVAAPSPNSPHVTGGALDICLYYSDGRPTVSCSHLLRSYNDEHTQLLEQIMCQAGFVRYRNEWWHFEYGTSRWQRGIERNECSA